MASKFADTTIYQELVSMEMWAERRIAARKQAPKPDQEKLKKLLLEQEAVKLAKLALDQQQQSPA